jgi:hypothetical protein
MSASKSFGSKKPRLAHAIHPGAGGMAGEVEDVREDIEGAFSTLEDLSTLGTGPLVVEEWTNPAQKVANLFMHTVNFGTSAQVITGTGLTGTKRTPPRNVVVTVTIGTSGGVGTITVKGTDVNGAAISEPFTIPDTSAAVVGNKAFATVTEVDIPAHGGHFTGSVVVGDGDKIGLAKKIKVRTGGAMVIKEIVNGSIVTNGTFVVPATGLPNGTYAPNSIPDGSADYAVMYEKDMT